MTGTYASTKSRSVTPAEPCPICKAKSRCLIGDNRIICYKEQSGSEKTTMDRNGEPMYIHRIPGSEPQSQLSVYSPGSVSAKRADVSLRHDVYIALLRSLSLSASHKSSLAARGIPDNEISRRFYRSLPLNGRSAVAKQLFQKFGDKILTVPGFIKKSNGNGEYITISGKPGILIPAVSLVDGRELIAGIKIRSDDASPKGRYRWMSSSKNGGPGAAPIVHVPRIPEGVKISKDVIRVTEGELKADAAFILSGVPTISIPGVSSWRFSIPLLQKLGTKTVRIAFDADAAVNRDVARSLLQYTKAIREAGFSIELEQWDASCGKGIDDVLAAGHASNIRIVSGDEASESVAIIAQGCGLDPERDANPNQETPNEGIDDPHRLARLFITSECTTAGGEITLAYWQDEWHKWNGNEYRQVKDSEIRARLSALAKSEFDKDNIEALRKYRMRLENDSPPPEVMPVTRSLIGNVHQALGSMCIVPSDNDQPSWISKRDSDPPAREVLATSSGLLHVTEILKENPDPQRLLFRKTARFFSGGSLCYSYDPNADCQEWLSFLESVWPDDPQSIACLQQWFGYLLLPDTKHHKMLMIVGPKRSGKGTIVKVLKSLIGDGNVASPKLSSFATQFGLWPLLGKTVAVITDARISGRIDTIQIVEQLLSISGEDPQDIHRKNLPTLTGVRMPVRFVLMTNEIPNLKDASGAMVSRVSLLQMRNSFFGKEDKTLENRLMRELPGILLWALAGRQSLEESGAFIEPESSQETLDDLSDLSSPISAFIRDRCTLMEWEQTDPRTLYLHWKKWCEKNGHDHPGAFESFIKNLRAALPQIRVSQPRLPDGSRSRVYLGIGLKPEMDANDASDAF